DGRGGQQARGTRAYGGQEVSCVDATSAERPACVTRLYPDDTGPYGPHAAGHVDVTPPDIPVVTGPPDQVGSWSVVADAQLDGVRLNAVHAILMPNGKVLLTAGSGNSPANFSP